MHAAVLALAVLATPDPVLMQSLDRLEYGIEQVRRDQVTLLERVARIEERGSIAEQKADKVDVRVAHAESELASFRLWVQILSALAAMFATAVVGVIVKRLSARPRTRELF